MASSDIKQLGSHTIIYGVGYVITRMIPFFLFPFYTHYIARADYGVVQLIYSTIGFMNIIFHYGLDTAFLRFFVKKDENFGRKEVFTHAFMSLLFTGVIFSSLIWKNSGHISLLLFDVENYGRLIQYSGVILLLNALTNIPLYYLRMVNKAVTFNLLNILNVILTFSLNVYFIHFLNKGIEYILISNIIASLVTLFMEFPIIIINFSFKIPRSLWKKMILFGLPFIPGGLASMILEMIGRFMLQRMTDLETVGLYLSGYKLGIFMLIVITAYKFAWQPFFLNKGDDPEAPGIFARIMTFFLAVLGAVYLAVAFYIHDILRLRIFGINIFDESYWGAEPIVPIILAAYIFLGIYMNLVPAIYFTEKTWVIPLFSGSAAIVNILLNYLLIPVWGMIGAAWATLIAYFWMAFLTWFITRKWYPIPYEWKNLFVIAMGVIVLSFAYFYFEPTSLLIKLLLLSLYIVLLFSTKTLISPRKILNIIRG
ncbi:MAG: oligosaccharide flippase family protein [Candidatus Marinimicrobia bacterium]|nr:oligosaccharide flippase family protein [Candidatus Neomarinimicrobiota bacterium]